MGEELNFSESGKIDLKQDFLHYRKVLHYLEGNVPIQVLCLPKSIESKLLRAGFVRVYDLTSTDFTKIKGLGVKSLDILASRLDEFFSMRL